METSPSRTIFLTGASSGIGAAIARILVAHGHQVFATARREEALEQVAQEAMAGATGNGRILTGVMDVLDPGAQQKAVARCVAEFGKLDVVIPNAGLGIFSPLDQAELDDWMTMVDVNVNNRHLLLNVTSSNAEEHET